ncbi:Pns10-1 [Oat sterile dwarf virus]|uniref:Pns10-1 n=1 Tax=Oat sterile dwarf virus TaxID=73147 RepID=O70788_9REOV|nr:Pns10-1 [Oat sterile dwarf virus]BAA25152.1 Pns10-1 [Oat sterile dwarf virus]
MADFSRRELGAFQVYEITTTQNNNSFNQNNSFTSNFNPAQRKPILDDGIYHLLHALVHGHTLEQSHFSGFEYKSTPTLSRTFATASAYVNKYITALIEPRSVDDIESRIGLCAPFGAITVYFAKDKDAKQRFPYSNDDFEVLEADLITTDFTPDHEDFEGMTAFCSLIRMFLTAFIVQLGKTLGPNDHNLLIQSYKHIAAIVANYDWLFNKEFNRLAILMYSFPELSFAAVRAILPSNLSVPESILQDYAKNGLFTSYESARDKKIVYKTTRASGLECSFFNKDYKPARTRKSVDTSKMVTVDISQINFNAQSLN